MLGGCNRNTMSVASSSLGTGTTLAGNETINSMAVIKQKHKRSTGIPFFFLKIDLICA
jgi:hypothetical protein